MRRRAVWAEVDSQRRQLGDLLAGLARSEWAVHSLCAGWTVRDVVEHLVGPAAPADPGAPPPAALVDDNPLPLVARLREPSVRHPSLARGAVPALVEWVVHGQDLARPLGRELAVRPETAARAAAHVWTAAPFRAHDRYPGLRFVTTDADLVLGEGTTVSGPATAVLLVLTGRTSALGELSGHGLGLLGRRVRA